MLTQLQTAVSLIYPPRCITCGVIVESDFGLCGTCWRDTTFLGSTVCDSCGAPLSEGGGGAGHCCDDCMRNPPPWEQARSAVLYKDTGRKMVLALKHGDRPEMAKPAGLWMANMFRAGLSPDTIVVPVPLHWTRLLKRRYNQSALLAKVVAHKMGLRWCPDALMRVKYTSSLGGMRRDERYAVLENAIKAHPRRGAILHSKPVLLIDDVLTTGATLTACTKACRAAGSGPVRVLTLARVDKDD